MLAIIFVMMMVLLNINHFTTGAGVIVAVVVGVVIKLSVSGTQDGGSGGASHVTFPN